MDDTFALEIDGRQLTVRVCDGTVQVDSDIPREEPSVRIVTDRAGLHGAGQGPRL